MADAVYDAKTLYPSCIAPQGSTPGPRYCSECGTPNKHDAAYCISCGRSLTTGR